MLKLQVALIADTTGSMSPCIREVRHDILQFCRELQEKRNIDAEVALLTHGDYCDGDKVITAHDFTRNWAELERNIRLAPDTSGGDLPECYELALNEANKFAWKPGYEKIIIMFGDDVPHPPNYYANTDRLDWRTEAHKLARLGITIYSIRCLDNTYANNFWSELAEIGNGYYLRLTQFGDVMSMIEAVIAQKGNYLDALAVELKSEFRLNRSIAAALETLSGGKIKSKIRAVDNGLEPVSPARFQVLKIGPRAIDIKSFVEETGAEFERGRGFYQFTKTEEIQERKEVVLVDRETGDMFTGAGARELIGLPYGERGRLRPVILDKYDVFVQSTSNNRKLMPNTKFLYEA